MYMPAQMSIDMCTDKGVNMSLDMCLPRMAILTIVTNFEAYFLATRNPDTISLVKNAKPDELMPRTDIYK